MSFVIERVVAARITVPNSGQKVTIDDEGIKDVEGITYFHLAKSIKKLETLFGVKGKSTSSVRPLAQTDLIEQLFSARARAVHALLCETDHVADPTEESGLDVSPARPQRTMSSLPRSIMIQTPVVHDVSAIHMRVLTSKANEKLFVELSSQNLEYLSTAIRAQIIDGKIKRESWSDLAPEADFDKHNLPCPEGVSVSVSHKRASLRMAYDDCDGRHTKYVKIDASDLGNVLKDIKSKQNTMASIENRTANVNGA